MAEDILLDEDSVVSIKDVVEEEQELQETANAVLGDSDDTNCTYAKGYISRQALYACATCNPNCSDENGGICLACSLKCHDGHTLYELYTKRNFRCDCGNSKFPNNPCHLYPEKEKLNSTNKYDHNFSGLYCVCNRPYPDSEDEVEDEMIQCVVCEDWFHTRHLKSLPPENYQEMVCDSCMSRVHFLRGYQVHVPEEEPTDTKENEQCVLNVGTEVQSDLAKAEPSAEPDSHSSSQSLTGATQSQTETKNCNESSAEEVPGGLQVESVQGLSSSLASDNSNCLLKKRLKLLDAKESSLTTGYFLSGWRAELCRCVSCLKLYKELSVEFLPLPEDTVSSYEERARGMKLIHEAGMDAMSSAMGHVQQVEMIREYNFMKQELSKFLHGFANSKKVVRARDIDDFFGDLQAHKRRRLDTGEGIPPNSCH